VLDNLYNRATVIANVEVVENMSRAQLESLYRGAEEKIGEWLERLGQASPIGPLHLPPAAPVPKVTSPYEDGKFQDGVRRIQEYITAGDTLYSGLPRRVGLARA